MPPESRKGTYEPSELNDASTTLPSVAANSRALANDSQPGFTKLPSELHLAILSYFPSIPDAEILANPKYIQSSKAGPDYLERFHVLLALSQTCRAVRAFYLPLCWERLQSSILSGSNRHWNQYLLGRKIERQSEGLMLKSPHLRPLVKWAIPFSFVCQIFTISQHRIVTVCLAVPEIYKPLLPFAKLLENLPNIHTIQIVNANYGVEAALKVAFHNKVFPSVRSVTLPNCAHDILKCCPGVREVTCNEHNGEDLARALCEGGCNQVEVLRGIAPTEFFAKCTPSLL